MMQISRLIWAAIVVFVGTAGYVRSQGAQFWNDQAQYTLRNALNREANLNRNVAKNIVFFVGDGMGIPTVTAARILKGQQEGMSGEEYVLSWEKFSSVALSKTYNTDAQVADSAGTATAYFCGVKTKESMIGVDDSIIPGNCQSTFEASVDSIMIDAERAGKATGFVTTTRVTHATPACLYAHTPHRGWENDADIPPEEAAFGCTDIANQLITTGSKTKVIMGGGRREFLPNDTADYEYENMTGQRRDRRNLIDEWLTSKDAATSRFVWNLEQFNNVDPESTENLMGLFETGHMQFEVNRHNDGEGEPSLVEMTEKAIRILQKEKNGFFLMVEGGLIDRAHHAGSARAALVETVTFNDAVAKAMELTNEEDTLVIVTADHSHVMSIGGEPSRGNPILGTDNRLNGEDGLPYTTLTYGNGPGGIEDQTSYINTGRRRNLTGVDTGHPYFFQPAAIPLEEETHGGEDVAIYANGPMSHLFHGVHEQNYIPHVVRYAACLGNTEHCDNYENPCGGPTNGASSRWKESSTAIYVSVIYVWVVLISYL